MGTPAPFVLVSDNGGPFNNPSPPDNYGLDINAGDSTAIKLASTDGVTNWYLQIGLVQITGGVPVVLPGTGADEITVLSPPSLVGVNSSGLVTTPGTTVTFTFPPAGRALLFTSTVTGSFGAISTTFVLFSNTDGGFRVGPAGLTRENNGGAGWAALVNPAIRAINTLYDVSVPSLASGYLHYNGATLVWDTPAGGDGSYTQNLSGAGPFTYDGPTPIPAQLVLTGTPTGGFQYSIPNVTQWSTTVFNQTGQVCFIENSQSVYVGTTPQGVTGDGAGTIGYTAAPVNIVDVQYSGNNQGAVGLVYALGGANQYYAGSKPRLPIWGCVLLVADSATYGVTPPTIGTGPNPGNAGTTQVWYTYNSSVSPLYSGRQTLDASGAFEVQGPAALFPNAVSTTIAAGSDGQTLPQPTLYLASVAGLPAFGSVIVDGSVVAYTGVDTGGVSLTGCTGGDSVLTLGDAVEFSWHTQALALGKALFADTVIGTGTAKSFSFSVPDNATIKLQVTVVARVTTIGGGSPAAVGDTYSITTYVTVKSISGVVSIVPNVTALPFVDADVTMADVQAGCSSTGTQVQINYANGILIGTNDEVDYQFRVEGLVC